MLKDGSIGLETVVQVVEIAWNEEDDTATLIVENGPNGVRLTMAAHIEDVDYQSVRIRLGRVNGNGTPGMAERPENEG